MAIQIRWAWGRGHRLLARHHRTTGELAYCLCHGPRRTTLAQLAAVAGARWAIEECFQQAKQTCGLDDYQIRGYRACYAHITLALLAYAALTGAREQAKRAAAEPARRLTATESITLLQALASVPDPRAARGRRHTLSSMLLLAVGAVLAGATSYAVIADWAAEADHELTVCGPTPHAATFAGA